MDPATLIAALSRPEAYLHPAEPLTVRQTHISVVFLAGSHVYKVKKPINLGFLDFTSLERRRHFCLEEVRLNRRLAPDVYRGVVPITIFRGKLQVDGEGQVVEWAVWMARLPDDATLSRRLRRGEVDSGEMASLANLVARFHRSADAGPHVDRFARWDVVARNARENLEQARGLAGYVVSEPVLARLRERTESALADLRFSIEERAAAGTARDTHGDLHLDHVYRLPERNPPRDWVIVDCIEFNERYRYADPVSDVAFLVMDLQFEGRPDLAAAFADGYLEAAADREGRALLPFYAAYRAAVRGKVDGIACRESEVPAEDRARALVSARAHWLLALVQLEEPPNRPCLVAVAGLPGTGKSTLARYLARNHGFRFFSTDRIRKELAGVPADAPARAPVGGGIYTDEWTERTYDALFAKASDALFNGDRVVLDATFVSEPHRRRLVEVAAAWGVPAAFLVCEAPAEAALRRVDTRHRDVSDADRAVYLHLAAEWSRPVDLPHLPVCPVPAGGAPEQAAASAVGALKTLGLLD